MGIRSIRESIMGIMGQVKACPFYVFDIMVYYNERGFVSQFRLMVRRMRICLELLYVTMKNNLLII